MCKEKAYCMKVLIRLVLTQIPIIHCMSVSCGECISLPYELWSVQGLVIGGSGMELAEERSRKGVLVAASPTTHPLLLRFKSSALSPSRTGTLWRYLMVQITL